MNAAITTQDLTVRFGNFTAVDHVSISVEEGEIFGFLGPNGSGKTTLIKALCGLLTPAEGKGSVLGFDCVTEADQIRQRVGYMSQKFSLYEDLTVIENIEFYAGVKFDVLDYSQVFVEAELLRHVSDALANLIGLRHAIEPEHRAFAFGRSEQSAQSFDQRRLARTVRAEEAEDFAFFDRDAHVVNGGEIAETNGQVLSCYRCVHQAISPGSRPPPFP